MKNLVIFMIVASSVLAHGSALQQQVGNYIVELGLEGESPNLTLVAALEDNKGNRMAGVETFLRISSQHQVVAASSHLVTDALGTAHLTHYFEKPGSYEVDITFSLEDKIKATFPVEIEGRKSHGFYYAKLAAATGAILLIGFLFGRRKRGKETKTNTPFIIAIIAVVILAIIHSQALIQNNNLINEINIQQIRAEAFQGIAGIENIESEHLHADWKIYLNNEPMDFYNEEYFENNRLTHQHRGESNEGVIHVHNKGITLRHYLTSIGIQAEHNCITIGETLCTNEEKTLTYRANEQPISPNYLIKDLDKILISYGKQEDLPMQLATIGNNACIQSNNC